MASREFLLDDINSVGRCASAMEQALLQAIERSNQDQESDPIIRDEAEMVRGVVVQDFEIFRHAANGRDGWRYEEKPDGTQSLSYLRWNEYIKVIVNREEAIVGLYGVRASVQRRGFWPRRREFITTQAYSNDVVILDLLREVLEVPITLPPQGQLPQSQ